MNEIRVLLEPPDDRPSLGDATVVIVVRDVTYADAPALEPVAAQTLTRAPDDPLLMSSFLDIPGELLEEASAGRRDLTLEVEVRIRDADVLSPGDLVSSTYLDVTRTSLRDEFVVPLTAVAPRRRPGVHDHGETPPGTTD
ncbi:MAG: hypothetical protein ACRCYR_19850 [Phycicoccus sp.]